MAVEILMPALSPTMEEGTLAKWLVKEGDVVKSGQIIAEIADEHGIRFVDLTGPRRFKALIGPRFTAYFELYQAGYSLKQIGGYFRDRDHTTILHGIRRHMGEKSNDLQTAS